MAEETKSLRLLQSPSEKIKMALAQMAMFRGARLDAKMLSLYAQRLSKERLEDVLAALTRIQDQPRQEGELSFPEVGAIISMARSAGRQRQEQDRDLHEYFQQQVCPVCGGIVGMMRPRGEQFRTWCVGCQSYRKITPEDLQLTAPQWSLVCMSLERIHREWRQRGGQFNDCVNPQFDREIARVQA